mgnify:CR=1 FL=1
MRDGSIVIAARLSDLGDEHKGDQQMVLSLLFCALQAIVFTTLVSIYLQEATE